MTREQYINAGYRVSASYLQAEIDRAECDVKTAYIEPIMPNATYVQDSIEVKVLMPLVFILLLKRSAYATRSGAKNKQTPQSQDVQELQQISENAHSATMWISKLREQAGAVKDAEVNDICKIYFKTNFGL